MIGWWGGSDYYVFSAKHQTCRHLKQDHINILTYIFKSIYFDMPDRKNHQIGIGDACPMGMGLCPYHITHANGRNIDLNYYTMGETNFTQIDYTPKSDYKLLMNIWNGDQVNKDLFDWERNYLLFKRVDQCFGKRQILIDVRLEDYITRQVGIKYGYKEQQYIKNIMQGTSPEENNHHLHVHFTIDDIQWNEVIDW